MNQEAMDNFVFHIQACRPETLGLSLQILLKHVVGWKEITKDGKLWLGLYDWELQVSKDLGATRFPAPIYLDQAVIMVQSWLQSKEPFEKSGRGPDGGESKGFEIIVSKDTFSDPPCLIRPIWAWHGK